MVKKTLKVIKHQQKLKNKMRKNLNKPKILSFQGDLEIDDPLPTKKTVLKIAINRKRIFRSSRRDKFPKS